MKMAQSIIGLPFKKGKIMGQLSMRKISSGGGIKNILGAEHAKTFKSVNSTTSNDITIACGESATITYEVPQGGSYSNVLWAVMALGSSIPNYPPVILLIGGQTTKFSGGYDEYSYEISGELIEKTNALGTWTQAQITITNKSSENRAFAVSSIYSCCIGATV